MTMPPLLLAAGALFWGWQNDLLALAVPMAVVLELWRGSRWRWEMEAADFNRVADFSSVAFAVLAIYQFNDKGLHAIFAILRWLPAILFPLVALQLYSRRGAVPLSALFVSLRRARSSGWQPLKDADLRAPFFLATLIAASAANDRSLWFFAGACLLIGWALWPQRPRRHPPLLWGALLAGALALGFAAQYGLQRAQLALEAVVLQWMQDHAFRNPSPDRAMTAIGMVGRLKFSDRVRLRVRTAAPLTMPLLLREASYSTYRNAVWTNRDAPMIAVETLAGPRTWTLGPTPPRSARLDLSAYLTDQIGVVPLPHGIYRLSGPAVLQVQANRRGTVMLESKPGYIDYAVDYSARGFADPPPTPEDLDVPEVYGSDLDRLVDRLGLRGQPPQRIVSGVQAFFRDRFTYSLVQRGRFPWTRPLMDFLLNRRSGHCEYFASATALLLRAAGIPSRYAIGYSVSEYSRLEGRYIARARDAHAWVLAYVEGGWQVVDTTPAVWRSLEDETASATEGLFDVTSWLGYQLSRWREGDSAVQSYLPWALIPLSLLLMWRLARRRRVHAAARSTTTAAQRAGLGLDSDFYPIVRDLIRRGHPLREGETLAAWVSRLPEGLTGKTDVLRRLLALHYRHRFDPQRLATHDRDALRQGMRAFWMSVRPGY